MISLICLFPIKSNDPNSQQLFKKSVRIFELIHPEIIDRLKQSPIYIFILHEKGSNTVRIGNVVPSKNGSGFNLIPHNPLYLTIPLISTFSSL